MSSTYRATGWEERACLDANLYAANAADNCWPDDMVFDYEEFDHHAHVDTAWRHHHATDHCAHVDVYEWDSIPF